MLDVLKRVEEVERKVWVAVTPCGKIKPELATTNWATAEPLAYFLDLLKRYILNVTKPRQIRASKQDISQWITISNEVSTVPTVWGPYTCQLSVNFIPFCVFWTSICLHFCWVRWFLAFLIVLEHSHITPNPSTTQSTHRFKTIVQSIAKVNKTRVQPLLAPTGALIVIVCYY